ncbi:MAG: protease inhibitor I9 family protein, partial [Acidimicrobiia bacterium]
MGLRRALALFLCAPFVAALVPVAPAAARATSSASSALQPANTTGGERDHIVILKDTVSVAAKVNKESSLGNEVSDVFASNVKGFVASLDNADVRRLKQDPQVLIVEADSTMSVIDTLEPTTTTVAPASSSSSSSTTSPTTSSTTSSSTSSTTSTSVPVSVDDLQIGDAIPGEYIVTLRSGVSSSNFAAAQADGGITILGTFSEAINGFGAALSKSQLSALASDPNVLLIEENTVVGVEGE